MTLQVTTLLLVLTFCIVPRLTGQMESKLLLLLYCVAYVLTNWSILAYWLGG